MKKLFHIAYDLQHQDTCLLDMYLPDTDASCPVFIFFHGGGLESGNRELSQEFIAPFLSKGIALVSADYRMYPEARFPEFVEDAAKAICYALDYGKRRNLFREIYVGGTSAGAYLSMMVYFNPHYLGQYGISPDDIKGWIFDAGQPTVHFNILRERGLDTRLVRVDEAAPLYFVDRDKNQAEQSELMFLVSDHDMVNRYEQTKLMLKTMEHFRYDMSKIKFRLMVGHTHCSYSIAGMASGFICGISGIESTHE